MFADLRPTEVLAAAERIRPFIQRTELLRSDPLSRLVGGDVFLKLENTQTTGSFKLRGAMNALATLPPAQQKAGVVASSAGNHGLGVAYAAKHFGVQATIFVPTDAPQVKRDGITALGATLDTTQPNYDAAMEAAMAFAKEHNMTFINPCLGHTLIAGQGTVALEILSEIPNLKSLVVNVGGAGLLGGCASLMRAVAPNARILGAQSEKTPAMVKSLAAGRVVQVPNLATLADGLAGQIDAEAYDIGKRGLDEMAVVPETEIGKAIAWLWEKHQQRVEGAGACGVAAVRLEKFMNVPTPAVIVLSGGNIDEAKHASIRTSYRDVGRETPAAARPGSVRR